MRKLIIMCAIVFVFAITVTMLTLSSITVSNSLEANFVHMVHETNKGALFLFYTFFVQGIDPDCIDMTCDKSSNHF